MPGEDAFLFGPINKGGERESSIPTTPDHYQSTSTCLSIDKFSGVRKKSKIACNYIGTCLKQLCAWYYYANRLERYRGSCCPAAERFLGDSFPYRTLFTNVLDCFTIGILGGYGTSATSETTRLLLITGLLDTLLTLSNFGWESIEFIRDEKVASRLTSVGLISVVGLVAVYGEYRLRIAFIA